MKEKQRYTTDLFDIDTIAAIAKLSLDEGEKESFLRDVCDMANYTYAALEREGVDDALALCALAPKKLSELRDDRVQRSEFQKELLQGAPDTSGEYVRVPRAIGSEEEQK